MQFGTCNNSGGEVWVCKQVVPHPVTKSLEKKPSCSENHAAADAGSSYPRVTFRAAAFLTHAQEFSSTVALLLTDRPVVLKLAGQGQLDGLRL